MLKSLVWYISRLIHTKSPKLSRKQLKDLAIQTRIPESELRSLYEQFTTACPYFHPNARESRPGPAPDPTTNIRHRFKVTRIKLPIPQLDRASMRLLYMKFFPFGDPRSFADRMFDVLDADKDGLVGFQEYAAALATARNLDENAQNGRLLFTFKLCDSDRDGFISRDDIMGLAKSLEDLVGSLSATINPSMAPANIPNNSPTPSQQHEFFDLIISLPENQPTRAYTDPANDIGGISQRPTTWQLPENSTSFNIMSTAPRPSVRPRLSAPPVFTNLRDVGSSFGTAHEWPNELSARVDRLMALLDVNRDGRVPFNEFERAVQNNPQVAHAMNLFAGLGALTP